MSEQVRWVSKAEAAEELEVSMSTVDRMIRRAEVEVRREGRRVYVRLEGPAPPAAKRPRNAASQPQRHVPAG